MNTTLILPRDTFDRPLSRAVLEGKMKPRFQAFLHEFESRIPTNDIRRTFRNAVCLAVPSPKNLHRFFAQYNYFNGMISTTIGRLVSNAASSANVFIDYKAANANDRIYSPHIAAFLTDAFAHELGDPQFKDIYTGAPIPHRILSTGLRNAVAAYARLSQEEEQAHNEPASWQVRMMKQIKRGYNGAEDNRRKIAFGLGVHNMSEYLASYVEFPTACDELFCRRKGEGLHQYLIDNPLITVGGYTFPAISWLLTHGGYNPESGEIILGVEFEHLQGGFLAAAMMASKAAPGDRAEIVEEFYKGAAFCAEKFHDYFAHMEKDARPKTQAKFNPEACIAA